MSYCETLGTRFHPLCDKQQGSKMPSLMSTANLPEPERFDFWREVICNTFLHLECKRMSDRPFVAEIATTQTKDVSFSRIRARENKIVRTPLQIRKASEEVVLVSLQLSGTCFLAQDGRETTLEPGDFVCTDSTRSYSAILTDDFEQLILHMPREQWIRRIAPTEKLTVRPVRGNSPMGTLVSNYLGQVVPVIENLEPVSAHRLSEVSLELVTSALGDLISQREVRQRSGRVALLYRAKVLIENKLHDPRLNSDMVARDLGISTRYLQNLFQEEDLTVSDWIWSKRLDKSRRYLSDPLLASKSVSLIAFDCGFSNFSHFSKRFKAEFSMTASEFRREQLREALQ